MHITHALGHLLPGRLRLTVATLVVAFCITTALAIGGTAAANAAGPAYVPPGGDIIFPTWFWGETEVCAQNLGNETGTFTVDPFPYDDGIFDRREVPAFETVCVRGRWWGNPVKVTNHGPPWMVFTSR